MILLVATIALLLIITLITAFAFAIIYTFRKIYFSIEVVETENNHSSILARHFPSVAKLAYEPLGIFPTPIHKASLPNGKSWYIKREDLSSNKYGGNKVRSLQFQLGSLKYHAKQHPDAKYIVLGSYGSNQTVATTVHGKQFGLQLHILFVKADEPDFDNTLNLLSILSFKVNTSAYQVF